MGFIDWSIVVIPFLLICFTAYVAKKYMKSVADFLAANRCAGKYLLGVADGIAGLGAVSIVAMFEMYYKAGFTAVWWASMTLPLVAIIAVTGWVQYRYRQTRALTMAQFFEMRYSRNFRVFAGFLCAVSGIVNFAIFPAVGGRFFQYYCGFPTFYVNLGPLEVDLVFGAIMGFLLLVSLAFTFMGGQIAVMVTDCLQGIFCNFVFIIIAVFLLFLKFDWSQMIEAFAAAPVDASLINPAKTGGTENFNITYFLIVAFVVFYGHLSWQGNQGYYVAAKSPHHAKMGRVIGNMRSIIQAVPMVLIPLAAFTLLHHSGMLQESQAVNEVLDTVEHDKLRSQLTVTVALTQILPVGLLGAFASVMLAAFISTHDTYLHSWGSMVVQDVVLPVRQIMRRDNKPLSAQSHIRWLRISILGVALFIFLFSWLIPPKLDILMFFALTGTIFLGWAGIAIIGGLYWKKGRTAGAWCAAIVGVTLAIVGWYVTWYWESSKSIFLGVCPALWGRAVDCWPAFSAEKFPLTPQVLFFWTIVACILAYVEGSLASAKMKEKKGRVPFTWAALSAIPIGLVVFAILYGILRVVDPLVARDLLGTKVVVTVAIISPIATYLFLALRFVKGENFNMDRLLHRGQYSVEKDEEEGLKKEPWYKKLFPLGKNHSLSDRCLYGISYFYAFSIFGVFFVGTIYMLLFGISDGAWASWWHIYCMFMLALSTVITIWVTIGGIHDIRELFHLLRTKKRDDADDGTVVGHVSLTDIEHGVAEAEKTNKPVNTGGHVAPPL